jgi:hypothetical protein
MKGCDKETNVEKRDGFISVSQILPFSGAAFTAEVADGLLLLVAERGVCA